MDEPIPEAAGEPPQPGRSPHSRRYVALRVLGAVLVAGAAFAIQRLVLADDATRKTFGATIRTKEIDSTALDRTLPVKVVVPKGAPPKDRSMVVFLHGRDENESSYLIDPMFRALADLRTRAPVMAFPDGGDSSFWHDRKSGEWGTYVLDEVIPTLVDRFDIDPDRIVIAGISMGGFGALDLAARAPGDFCAVAAHSPTLWQSAGEAADGAFDDSADFESNDVISLAGSSPSPYADLPVWLDAGDDDPFLAGDDAFEQALRAGGREPIVRRSPGGHDLGYWNSNWDEYMAFYARSLRGCRQAEQQTQGSAKPNGKPKGGGEVKPNEKPKGAAENGAQPLTGSAPLRGTRSRRSP